MASCLTLIVPSLNRIAVILNNVHGHGHLPDSEGAESKSSNARQDNCGTRVGVYSPPGVAIVQILGASGASEQCQ